MIYARILTLVIGGIGILYYALIMLQCFGLIKFSKEDISFPKILIPFYYFFK